MGIRSHRDLIVWQRGLDLVVETYAVTARFPAEEKYGLISQARRSAVAVPANIAEGNGRLTTGELIQSLGVARGELRELETYCEVATRVHMVPAASLTRVSGLIEEVGRMLTSSVETLGRRRPRRR